MKRVFTLLIFLTLLSACEKLFIEKDIEDTPQNNFRIFWEDIDQHYTLFPYYPINWDSVYINNIFTVSDNNLQEILLNSGKQLKDGHFALFTKNKKFYAFQNYAIPEGYTSNSAFNVNNYFQIKKLNNRINYGYNEDVGYVLISGFGKANETQIYNQIDALLDYFATKKGLIIDIRSNEGGALINAEIIASRFYKIKKMYSKIRYRNGKGHNDFTDFIFNYIEPANKIYIDKPVVILTNRYTASASENFLLAMKDLTNVTIVGDTTSGGLGSNEFHELPNGWSYRISVSVVLSANDELYEGKGIPPDHVVMISKPDSIAKKDMIIEKAIDIIRN